MRSRRLIATVLLLGAALTLMSSSLYASEGSSSSQAQPVPRTLYEPWQSVGRLVAWLGGFRIENGCSPDPNGGQCLGSLARTHGAAGRARPVRPDEGCSPDPNGGHCHATLTRRQPRAGRAS
jgi:hypothetical protein